MAVVIDGTTVRDNLDQLASELLRLLVDSTTAASTDLELVNFVELLLSKSSSSAVERMLLHRKIPGLSAEMSAALGLCPITFTDPVPAVSGDLAVAATAAASTLTTAQETGEGDDSDDSDDDTSDDESDGAAALVVRPVAAAHRETSVARQIHQGKTAELRCAKEEAARLWPWICKGRSEPWASLSAEFQRINQLGARGGGVDLIDVRRPGSEAALAARLHVAAVAEGIGYDVLSVEGASDSGGEGGLVRIEVKSCAARRPLAGAQGLKFYMSEAERKMAALYLKSPSFKGESWKLQMYAPPEGAGPPADGSGASVGSMVAIDLTSAVADEILLARPDCARRPKRGGNAGGRGAAGILLATEWSFAL